MLDTNQQFSTGNHMTEAIMSTRWIFRKMAGLLLTVAVPTAMAQAQLSVSLSNVFVQWQGFAPTGVDPDPLFVERNHGIIATDATTRGRSSLADGRMRAYSSSFNYPEGTVASYAGITVSFENTGTAPLMLAAGDLRANFDLSMLRVAGVGPGATPGTPSSACWAASCPAPAAAPRGWTISISIATAGCRRSST